MESARVSRLTTPSRLAGVVFDLDGTLVDSAPVLEAILNDLRQERGSGPLPLDKYKEWSSVGGLTLIQNALDVPIEQAGYLLDEFRRRYALMPTPETSIYPGVRQGLRDLKSSGLQLSICSNKPAALCNKVLRDLNLEDFFPVIVAGDTLTCRKPDPGMLGYAVAQMGLELEQIILVGDSLVDFQTAQNAGARFMIFEGGYGHGVQLEYCHYRLKNFSDILDVLGVTSND